MTGTMVNFRRVILPRGVALLVAFRLSVYLLIEGFSSNPSFFDQFGGGTTY